MGFRGVSWRETSLNGILAYLTPEEKHLVHNALRDAQECAELVELAAGRLARSETVTPASGGSEINPAPTSDGMSFTPGENQLTTAIAGSSARLLHTSRTHS